MRQLKYSNWFCPNVTTSQVASSTAFRTCSRSMIIQGPLGAFSSRAWVTRTSFAYLEPAPRTVVPLQAGGPPDKFVPGEARAFDPSCPEPVARCVHGLLKHPGATAS